MLQDAGGFGPAIWPAIDEVPKRTWIIPEAGKDGRRAVIQAAVQMETST